MSTKLKRIIIAFSAAFLSLALLVSGTLALFYFHKPLTKKILLKRISGQAGYKIEIERLDYRLFPLTLELEGLKISRNVLEEELAFRAERVAGRGRLRSLLKKGEPLFDSVELERPSLHFVRGRGEDAGGKNGFSSLSRALSSFRRFKIKDGSLSLTLQRFFVGLEKVDISAAASDKQEEWIFTVSSSQVRMQAGEEALFGARFLRFSGLAKLDASPSLEGEGELGFPQVVLKESVLSSSSSLVFKTKCFYRQDQEELHFPQLEVSLAPLFQATGGFMIQLKENLSARWRARVEIQDLKGILGHLKPLLPAAFESFDVTGAASLEGDGQYSEEAKPETYLRLSLDLEPTTLAFSSPDFSWRQVLSGRFQIEGSIPGASAAGELKIRNGSLERQDIRLEGLALDLPLKWTRAHLSSPGFRGRAKIFSLTVSGQELNLPGLVFSGKGNFNPAEEVVYVDALEWESPTFPPFRAQAKLSLRPGGRKWLSLKSSKMTEKNVLSFLHPFVPAEIFNWNPAGDFQFEAEGEVWEARKRPWNFKGRLTLDRGTFHDPSQTRVGDGLTAEFSLSAAYAPPEKSLSFFLSFQLGQGETLWKEFYIGWSANPLRGEIQGEFALPGRQVFLREAAISLSPFGRLRGSGRLWREDPLSFDLELFLEIEDSNSLYSFLSRRTEEAGTPFRFSGLWNGRVRLKRGEGLFSAAGEVRVDNAAVDKTDSSMFIKGMGARLPFHLSLGERNAPEKEEKLRVQGYFRLGEFKTPYFLITQLGFELSSGVNSWRVGPVVFDLWGGKASLGPTFISCAAEDLALSAISSLNLSGGRVAEIPLPFENFSLSGNLAADLPRIEVNSESLTASGGITVSLFSGRVRISNVRLDRPFSRGRVISGEVSFSEVDLEKMRDTLPFGRVTGIIKGEIEDLAFSYGQPEKFRLRLESVRRPGVRQAFSLKAVDDLTILSSGKGPLPSQSFFLRFVPEFPYEKIGIFCSLKNDVFSLRGLIKEGGIEYLVKKARPFGINIVNRDPRSQVSFKEMGNRLKRIGASEKKPST